MGECHPFRSLHPHESDWWPLFWRSSVLTRAGEDRDCLPVCQPAFRALHEFSQAWNSWRTGRSFNNSPHGGILTSFGEISPSMLEYQTFIVLVLCSIKVLEHCLTFTQSLFDYFMVIHPIIFKTNFSQNHKYQSHSGTRGQDLGSPKSVRYIVWKRWMSVPHGTQLDSLLELGTKWWTDWQMNNELQRQLKDVILRAEG